MKKKLAVIVGHNAKAPGAYAPAPIGSSEFYFWDEVADHMVQHGGRFGLEVRKFHRVKGGGYGGEVRRVYREVDAWGPDESMELHFNCAGPTASGTETLYSGSAAGEQAATRLQAAQVGQLGLADRGLKVKGRGDRGGLSLHAGRAPATLIEPFFASNSRDVRAAAALGPEGMAMMLLAGAGHREEQEEAPPVLKWIGKEEAAPPALPGLPILPEIALTKEHLMVAYQDELAAFVAYANATLPGSHALSLLDLRAVMNAELGISEDGYVDAGHRHSLGEQGALPLPASLQAFVPEEHAAARDASLTDNVRRFALYLKGLKNHLAYAPLFTAYAPDPAQPSSAYLLAAAVHGYLWSGNFRQPEPLPRHALAALAAGGMVGLVGLQELLALLGYKHPAKLVTDRYLNLATIASPSNNSIKS